MSDDFTDATDVLKNLFDRLMPEKTGGYTGLFSGWDEIVGPEMSQHVVLKDVINGSLVLEADHPGWIQKTRMKQSEILRIVREKYPELEIKRLKISVGDGSRKPASEKVKTVPIQVAQSIEEKEQKTPPVASGKNPSEEDRNFYDLLEQMRRHGDS